MVSVAEVTCRGFSTLPQGAKNRNSEGYGIRANSCRNIASRASGLMLPSMITRSQ